MTYIGLVSDTHGVFPKDVMDFLAPVDQVWHAGDFGTLDCARAFSEFKPLVGVHGNCDGQDLRMLHPRFRAFECEGLKVLMTHIGLRRGSYWAFDVRSPLYDAAAERLIEIHQPDIFVCGHSHIPQVFKDPGRGFLFINPGACGLQGTRDVPRMALRLKLSEGRILDFEKCELPRLSRDQFVR